MRILLVGSGGREHAIAWKLVQSAKCTELFIAPGNDGMADLGTLVNLNVHDADGLSLFAKEHQIDLAVIGPEVALEAGVSDALTKIGVAVFGPSREAAQLETSKSFAKQFMTRHHVPTARFAIFDHYLEAKQYLEAVNYPVVIKASGLAAGKGVIIPQDHEEGITALHAIMVDKAFGEAGKQVVIEERLSGPEVSLLAFSDGVSIHIMPSAQDHKRLLEGDQGPNTGGMGTYAPAPVLTNQQLDLIRRTILKPVIDGMREEGMPYIGVLYTGLILTKNGPSVLEFNARFGDPETQVILPLLESDLVEIFTACTEQRLRQVPINWSKQVAVCVVLASQGYPQQSLTGKLISGLDTPFTDGMVFHAGTRKTDAGFVNAGGRVLGVTCWRDTLSDAIQAVYDRVDRIHFEGRQYRRDIAHKTGLGSPVESAYQAAGVDIDAGNRAVQLMKFAVQSTYTPRVLSTVGSFGGLFDVSELGKNSVLVASTDGVGTKVELAARLGRYRGIGADIVNHCVDDILVQGAKPLFFLDYFATAKLDPVIAAEIVTGMADACKQNDCALLGGETAEMPGVYTKNAFDVAGTIVGVVNRENILPRMDEMQAGDLLLGFKSASPHTNGYSLIRRLCEGEDLEIYREELGGSLADILLTPHRSYMPLLAPILDRVKGLAHITGGGFIENIPRILPSGLQALIKKNSWPIPPVYDWLQETGKIRDAELYRVFNVGIGMVAVVSRENLDIIQEKLSEEAYVIGYLSTDQTERVIINA